MTGKWPVRLSSRSAVGPEWSNMRITLKQVAEATGGELRGGDGTREISGVSTDSRTIQSAELFVALPGERFDGHDFAAEAFAYGAAAAMVERELPELSAEEPLVIVEDALRAYGQIAGWYRSQLDVTVVAVTGSVGKTTTKNMIGSILARYGPTLIAPGNLNNEVGVPRVLLSLTAQHRYCVVELAMRGPGEIGYLARMASPQVGVITNVGETHLGLLGTRDAIAQAKAEVLEALPDEGRAVLNADDFYCELFAELSSCPTVSFGYAPQADVRIEDVELRGLQGAEFALHIGAESVPVQISLPGGHNVTNAAAAAAAAWAVTGSTANIAAGLVACPTEEMRTEVGHTSQGVTVINDAYNAAPRSVMAALEMLAGVDGRKIFVFGDMLELGPATEEEHRRIGRLCVEQGIYWLIGVGRWGAVAVEEAASGGLRADVAESTEAAVALICPELMPSDVVLVKASRAMALERVVEGLMADV